MISVVSTLLCLHHQSSAVYSSSPTVVASYRTLWWCFKIAGSWIPDHLFLQHDYLFSKLQIPLILSDCTFKTSSSTHNNRNFQLHQNLTVEIGDMINVFQMLVKLFVSLWWCALLSLIDPPVEASSITNPLRHDGDISKVVPGYFDVKRKKDYFNMTPNALKDLPFISHNHPDPACNVGFHLAWSTTVGSAVFASPVSFPDRDGKRQLFLR